MKNKTLFDKTFWGMLTRFSAVIIITLLVITVIGLADNKSREVTSSVIDAVE